MAGFQFYLRCLQINGSRCHLVYQGKHAVFHHVEPGGREQVPTSFALCQNYPNPFNPLTIIKFTIGGTGGWGSGPSDRDSQSRQTARPELGARDISLIVYDVLGRQVAVLVDEKKAPGNYEVTFSAKGGSASGGDGGHLASGIYIYRLTAGSYVASRKMVLVK